MRLCLTAAISLILATASLAQPAAQTAPPPTAATALVLGQGKAADWLNAAAVPARVVQESELPAALTTAALVVLPLQEVRRPETVAALKDYTAKGGRILGTFWGPAGIKSSVSDPLASLFAVNVTGFSLRGNTTIATTATGRPLFNSTGRLSLGRGYSVIANAVIPPQPKPAVKPNSGGTTSQSGGTPAQAGAQPQPPPPVFVAGRWVKQDGRPLREKDTAVVQSPSTLWIAEDIFASANDSAEVRRWFVNAAVTMAPSLRLPAKQGLITAAQNRLAAARTVKANALAAGVDAPLTDAQTSLDTAEASLAAAGKEMEFAGVLKGLEAFERSLADAVAQCNPSLPVEIRAVWLEQASIPKTLDEVRRLVGRLADAKFNVLLPEMVYRGCAAYPSTVYPQDSRYNGFDPLRALITEARKRGMEIHPWVWALCAGADGEQGPILSRNPAWAARDKAGRTTTDVDRLFWLSPSNAEARTAVRNVVRELAARYEVDGVMLDYIGYDSTKFDYSDIARNLYEAANGLDPLNISSVSPENVMWTLWREAQVNSLVREIHDDLTSVNPRVKLGVSAYSTAEDARRDRLQNWAYWVENGWLDWVALKTASRDPALLTRRLGSDIATVGENAYVAAEMGVPFLPDVDTFIGQLSVIRASSIQGLSVNSAGNLTDDILRTLRLGPFRNFAALPWADSRKATSLLAATAASLFNTIPASDAAIASAARAASSAASKWASLSLTDMTSTPLTETEAPALADARYNEPRALLNRAKRIINVSLRKPSAVAIEPSRPPVSVVANPLPLPSLQVRQTTANIVVDGNLNEPSWQTATEAVIDRAVDGTHAKVGANVRVMRDTSNLYIGFTCPEPSMAGLKASATGRDGRVFEDDSVEVFLSNNTYGLPYYHFIVSASGATWDDRSGDKAWNGRWSSAVQKDAASWSVEITLPFSALNTRPTGIWKANLFRNRTQDGASYTNWSVVYGNYHTPDRFGAFVM